MDLPQVINTYWDGLGTLPSLKFQYAPAKYNPPVAVFRPVGFARDYSNGGFWIDTHRYSFSVIDTDAVAAYENGFSAVTAMQSFNCPGFISITCEPESFATPTETGQANSWQMKFSVDIQITPS